MKKLICAALILSITVLSLTGCDLGKTNIDKMLKAPALTGETAKVDTALKQYTGNDITLKNAVGGEYRSAYILKDIDNDGKPEAFVFYAKKFDSNVFELHLNFLRNNSGWESVNDILIKGDQINEINFLDINNDGNLEVFVGALSVSELTNVLEGYFIEGDGVIQCFKENYTVYSGIDINNDGTTEIVTIELNSEQKTSVASAYKVESNSSYKLLGSCQLDGKILSYKTLVVSKLTNGMPALFVDAYKTSNSLITEIIYWNNELIAPFYDWVRMENTLTLRNSDIESKDYNNDGSYEIPFLSEFSQTSLAEDHALAYITNWRSYDSVQFSSVANELANYTEGYALELPDNMVKKFILKRELKTKERIFYNYNAKTGKTGTEAFRIKAFTKPDWSNNSDKGFKKAAYNNTYVFAIKVSDKNISFESINKMFRVLN